jgi:uncharacterized membrane protein
MQMRRWLFTILATLALAAVFHVLTVMAFPRVMMLAFALKVKDPGRTQNVLYHQPRVTAASRLVVMPSPDLLYSACAYDVSKAPLRISASVPDTYWSLSLFASNTDNFFVINDQEIKASPVDILLVGPGMEYKNPGKARVVASPSSRGVALIRILITDENRIEELAEIQRQAFCRPVDQAY